MSRTSYSNLFPPQIDSGSPVTLTFGYPQHFEYILNILNRYQILEEYAATYGVGPLYVNRIHIQIDFLDKYIANPLTGFEYPQH